MPLGQPLALASVGGQTGPTPGVPRGVPLGLHSNPASPGFLEPHPPPHPCSSLASLRPPDPPGHCPPSFTCFPSPQWEELCPRPIPFGITNVKTGAKGNQFTIIPTHQTCPLPLFNLCIFCNYDQRLTTILCLIFSTSYMNQTSAFLMAECLPRNQCSHYCIYQLLLIFSTFITNSKTFSHLLTFLKSECVLQVSTVSTVSHYITVNGSTFFSS